MSQSVWVAVGVIFHPGRKEVLLAKRPVDKHQGGLWEFPGGKVDAGEMVEQALSRELFEELALTVTHAQPLIKIEHDYIDKSVILDVWLVDGFTGAPIGAEGQVVRWVSLNDLAGYEFPEANQPILDAIAHL